MTTKTELRVVSQKANPASKIFKNAFGSFCTEITCTMEDGTERSHVVTCTRKRDLVARLGKLPIENVKGMTLSEGYYSIELFGYNGI